MVSPVQWIKQFYGEVIHEVKRCSWPTRTQLMEHTALVILAVILMTIFIYIVDLLCQYGILGVFKMSEQVTNLFS